MLKILSKQARTLNSFNRSLSAVENKAKEKGKGRSIMKVHGADIWIGVPIDTVIDAI